MSNFSLRDLENEFRLLSSEMSILSQDIYYYNKLNKYKYIYGDAFDEPIKLLQKELDIITLSRESIILKITEIKSK